MENRNGEIRISDVEAKAGTKDSMVGRVLLIGTILAIMLLAIIWITGALSA